MREFPPELDVDYYRNTNLELKYFPDDVVKIHYSRYCEIQGRSSCEYDTREGLQKLLSEKYKDATILEIGPFDNPLLLGENVEYFDVLNET